MIDMLYKNTHEGIWAEYKENVVLEEQVKDELSLRRAQEEMERNYLEAEEANYVPFQSDEDFEKLGEEGHRQYLDMMAGKNKPSALRRLILVPVVMICLSGCELTVRGQYFGQTNLDSRNFSPEQAKQVLREKY